MKRHHVILFALCLLAMTQIVGAAGAAERFETIAHRNSFRLRPPTLKEERSVEVAERQQITLQGLTTILGRPQVLLQIQKPKTTGSRALSCIMTTGERQEGVTVLTINMQTQTVRIINVDLEQTLKFGR